jgi:hypothetical protein
VLLRIQKDGGLLVPLDMGTICNALDTYKIDKIVSFECCQGHFGTVSETTATSTTLQWAVPCGTAQGAGRGAPRARRGAPRVGGRAAGAALPPARPEGDVASARRGVTASPMLARLA